MRKRILYTLLSIQLCLNPHLIFAQQIKILFDAKKAETAGNADWVIDADQNNLNWNPGPIITGSNTYESNAQRLPTPAQSGVTSSTPETYWKGALSSWGIDCAKKNYTVETLPYNGSITYNDGSNPQDLSNYKVYIVCEPNIVYTDAEKTAILNFVKNGGGLFMISDHNISDRNGDNWDSPNIWNNMLDTNSVQLNPLGIKFNLDDFSETSTTVSSSSSDSVINGPMGTVSKVKWTGGTSITIDPAKNASVRASVYRSGMSGNNSKVLVAYAHFGSGKVVAMADSSPADDSTGDVNDNLYNGYITDANGNHRTLIMNATIWLATSDSLPTLAVPTVSSNSPLCAGDSLILHASASPSNAAIHWTGPNGFTATGSNQVIHNCTTANAGSYSATVSATGYTTSAASTTVVTINPIPAVSLIASKNSICSGDSVTLSASGATSYTWTPAGNGNPLVVHPVSNTTYSVKGTSNGCSKSVEQLIAVTTTPSTPSLTVNNGNDTLFCSGSGTTYEWYKNAVLLATTTTSYYLPNGSGVYTVQVLNNTCTSASSAPVSYINTSIVQRKNDATVSILPNPNNGSFLINFNAYGYFPIDIRILDITGKAVYEQHLLHNNISNIQINSTELPMGIYDIQISDSTEIWNQKILIP